METVREIIRVVVFFFAVATIATYWKLVQVSPALELRVMMCLGMACGALAAVELIDMFKTSARRS